MLNIVVSPLIPNVNIKESNLRNWIFFIIIGL